MNYKCTNVECGWEGDIHECPLSDRNAQGYFRVCPKCYTEAIEAAYTRVPPTEPGYYWQKDSNIIRIVEVSENYSGWEVRLIGIDDILSLDGFNCEWSARLEPPK